MWVKLSLNKKKRDSIINHLGVWLPDFEWTKLIDLFTKLEAENTRLRSKISELKGKVDKLKKKRDSK